MVYTMIALFALMAVAAIGIDLGHLAFTASEVQSAAEVAATAGATALLNGGSVQGDALAAAAQNTIHGNSVTAANLPMIESGNFDNGTFASGGLPANAVRATASVMAHNLLGGILGQPESPIFKRATATFSPTGRVRTEGPFALCNGFDPNCSDNNCPPHTLQLQTPGGSFWTAFFAPAMTPTDVRTYFPLECGGDSTPMPILDVNDHLHQGIYPSWRLSAADQLGLLTSLNCVLGLGTKQFLVPIVSCSGNLQEIQTVLGFATIVIDSIDASLGTLTLHQVVDVAHPGPPAPLSDVRTGLPSDAKTGFVTLVSVS